VPRAATTTDIFTALAESQRRDILVYLTARERAVGEVVEHFGLGQPSISKHLKVLREVGLVEARREGRQMLYRTNLAAMRPLREFTGILDRLWKHELTRVKARPEAK
jgi:DNA-binding transcriptional ArsR family regulator